MSNFFLSLVLGASIGGWLYFKFQKREGNNSPAAIGALVCGIIIFIVVYTTIATFFHK